MRKLFLLFVAFVATTCLWAEDFSVNGIYYNYLEDNNVEVTYRGDYPDSYSNEYYGKITIPSTVTTYNGTTYSVTSIGEGAFLWCSALTSVTIGNSVTSIADAAFADCSSLTSITIPNSVISIGDYAFRNCSSLTSITIPERVATIGESAFHGCSSLTSVPIPTSVTSIGDYAFRNCSSLTSMVVETGNTIYDSRDNCNAIIETATNTLIAGCQNTTIPNSVTSIGESAFENCDALTSVTIPNSVTSIGESAFEDCSALTSVTIGNSVTSIGESAFEDCSALTSVTLNSNDIVSKKYTYGEGISDIFGSQVEEYVIGAVVIVGTPNWSQYVNEAAKDPITKYSNIMYALHFYAGTHKAELRNTMVKAVKKKLPIFVSEFGMTDASGNGYVDKQETEKWFNTMNKYNIGYCAWSLSNKPESSALINSSCTKKYGFKKSDLSESGRWIYLMYRKYAGKTK